MIFNRIKIENFGILHNFELELTSGLNLFSRPNEAGKSTLLEFVRRLFWGYPDRRKKCNLYPQLHDSGRYGGEIHVTMDSGRKLRLERYGLKGELRCFDLDENRELPDSEWNAAHLAGCSETFFRNVFAITLDELVSLESVETSEIKQLLYGAELGIDPKKISRLTTDLKNSADRIFRSRGSCELNTVLQKYDELIQEHRAALNAEERISQISAEQESLTVESAGLAASLRQLHDREQLLTRAENRRQLMQEIAELQQRRAALPPLPDNRLLSGLKNLLNTLPEPEMITSCRSTVADLQKTADGEKTFLDTMLDTSKASPLDNFVILKLSKMESLLAAEVETYLSAIRRRKILLFCTMLPLLAGLCAAILSRMPELLCLALGALLPLSLLFKLKITLPLHADEAEKLRSDVEKQLAVKGDFSCDKLSELNFRLEALQRSMADISNQQQQLDAMLGKQQEFELKCRELALSPVVPEQLRAQLKLWQETADRLRLVELELTAKSARLAAITLPEEISALSSEAIAENFAGINTQRRNIEEKQLAAANRRGQLENEQQLLEKHGSSAAAGTRLDTAAANIRELAGEYITASIARELLELAVKRFESEHQPAVLEFTSKIFAGLTGGRYTSVWRQLSSGELLFRDQHSNIDKHFDELSRGCREQLLLALRLALIQHRELNAEKIPVILDDVLVDFDRQRRSAAISALRKFAADRQVILLSCREIPEAAE